MFPQPILDFIGTAEPVSIGFALAAGFWIVGVKVATVWKAFTVACDVSPHE